MSDLGQQPISEEELHAYIDNRLDAVRLHVARLVALCVPSRGASQRVRAHPFGGLPVGIGDV